MRALKMVGCAVALTALLAPGAHADEWNKLTYLTFSAPVQLPGITLPAGSYAFKLADSWSNRHILQVFNKQQTKVYGTFLTVSDQKLDPSGKPVVTFREAPAGTPTAVRAFFYPGDTIGDEFVYPKQQAVKIAKATHQPVMATAENMGGNAASMKGARVGHVDENGRMTEDNQDNRANAEHAANGATGTSGTTGTYTAAPRELNHRTGPAENADVMNRYNQNGPSPLDRQANRSMARGGETVTSSSPATGTSASNRAHRHHAAANAETATGTSGQTGTTANTAKANANNHAAANKNNNNAATARHHRRHLPQTASPLGLFALLSGLSLAGAGSLRQLRKRYADAR